MKMEIYGWGERPSIVTDHRIKPEGRLGVQMLAIEPEIVLLPVNRCHVDYLIQMMAGMGSDWRLAARLVAIGDRHRVLSNQLIDVAGRLAMLEALPRCCGWIQVRENGVMYAHHRIHDDCPMHGRSKSSAKRGLRKFVRKEDEAGVEAAVERYQEWVRLSAEFKQLDGERRRIEAAVKGIEGV